MKTRLALALAPLALVLTPAAASAADFAVTTTADGNAACTVVQCTLRAALSTATTNGNAADVITVPAGTYTLTQALGGQLNVPGGNTGISIRGAGANATIIQPDAAFRLLNLGTASSVALSDLTLRNGEITSGNGGNVLTTDASLNLARVRITGGRAQRGGGIAAVASSSGGTLTINQSLIDGNTATALTTADLGGGIYSSNATGSTTVLIQDSTLTGNQAQQGGAIGATFGPVLTLRGVTVARNSARANPATGGVFVSSTSMRFQGSIVASNTAVGGSAQNCSVVATDDGGNVESGTDCGFATGQQSTDAQLSAALDTTASPPVLTIPKTSPAVDFAVCGARTLDQRGVTRPQGLRCDSGAFEYKEPDPAPTPTPTPTPPPPVATPTATATPAPTATPVFHSSVAGTEVKGTIRVRRPGSSTFQDIDPSVPIPLNSTVDARKGTVEITSVPKKGGKPEKAQFFDGLFKITQPGSITQVQLTEPLAACKKGKASASATKPKKRRLWGDGKGKFRTKGSYSAATVRGTKWLVEDSCAGTLTKVTQGSVSVRDTRLKKTVIVRAGKSYTARPRR